MVAWQRACARAQPRLAEGTPLPPRRDAPGARRCRVCVCACGIVKAHPPDAHAWDVGDVGDVGVMWMMRVMRVMRVMWVMRVMRVMRVMWA